MNKYDELLEKLKKSNIDVERSTKLKDSLGYSHYVELLVSPKMENIEESMNIIYESNLPFLTLGGMCNSFLSSKAYLIIVKTNKLKSKIEIRDNYLYVSASEKISSVSRYLSKIDKTASSLEAIPGTLGGAIKMNAGAFGVDINKFVKTVRVVGKNGIEEIDMKNSSLGYRNSIFSFNDKIIIDAVLSKYSDEVNVKIKDYKEQRSFRKLYLESSCPNLGSTFATKNIYDFSNQNLKSKIWVKLLKTLPFRIIFKLYEKSFSKKFGFSKRFILLYLISNFKGVLKIINHISYKTLNTYCFNNKKDLKYNKDRFLIYINLIRKISKDSLKEEVKIF